MEKSSSYPHPGASTSAATASGESALLRSVEQAGSTLHETIDKVADPARNTVERAAAAAHVAVDRMASGASQVASKVSDQAQRLSDTPVRALDNAKALIQEHQLQAVGAALLLGLIVGRLTGHRD